MRTPILTLLCVFLFAPCTARAACDPNIPADLSGDCHVNFNDFAIMAADWLKPAVPHEWVARYDGPDSYIDSSFAIVVDSNDNIYVTGESIDSGTAEDYLTIKYSPDTNQPVWIARYDGPGYDYQGYSDHARAIVADSDDNIYVTGFSHFVQYPDYATVKYSPDSNQPVWIARYNGPGDGPDVATAMASDSNDNIYVTGYSEGSAPYYDYATIKYSPDSNEPVWVARYSAPPGNSDDMAQAIVIDGSDNIYVTGIGYYDYLTIKYSPDSNQPVWIARYNGPGNGYDWAEAIAVDSNDNIYVTGRSIGSATGYYDYATTKYSPDSNQPVWVVRYNGPDEHDMWDRVYAIAMDSNDNIYVTGYSEGSGTYVDYTTIKYSPDYSCTPQINGDFDHNCTVDIYDLTLFCRHWLDCSLDPPEDCWQ
jgi:uncharacterized delta-60 repeat protein